jgi:hypothetical protein
MTRLLPKPTNLGNEGVAAPVSALVDRMPPDFVRFRAQPARAAVRGCFAIRGH